MKISRAILTLSLNFFLLNAIACCDQTTLPETPSFWLHIGEGYFPALSSITSSESAASIASVERHTAKFSSSSLDGALRIQRYGFWLDLTNRSEERITLLWPEARYVDELGQAHEVFQQPRGALPDNRNALATTPPVVLSPEEQLRPTIVPLYKQYQVSYGCRGELPYSEPLIPTNLRELSEEEAKTRVDEIYREQIPVKLILPVEVGGQRYDYVFSITLKDSREELREATPEEQRKIDELEKMIDTMEASDGMDLGKDHP